MLIWQGVSRIKIGILTHYYVSNYGAFLQTYCLQETLKALFPGDSIYVIRYLNRRHYLINTAGCFRFFRRRDSFRSWREKTKLPRLFRSAQNKYLCFTGKARSADGINALGLDAVVVGSDEVWNYNDKKSFDSAKFGVGLEAKTLAAYAPSVGKIGKNGNFDNMPPGLKDGLAKFTSLSARDENTADLIFSVLNTAPARVLDPVFLHMPPVSGSARIRRLMSKPYILFYHCAPLPPEAQNDILQFAARHQFRLLGAGEYNRFYDEVSVALEPFEWAELFTEAEYVITGTFHGAVLSLINNRQFSVCPNNPTRAGKIKALLSDFGLDARYKDADGLRVSEEYKDKIDYDEIRSIITEKKTLSIDYLKRALQKRSKINE